MSRQWFIHDGTQQKGPFTEDAITEMLRKGILNDRTALWTEGVANWIPLRDTPFSAVGVQQHQQPGRTEQLEKEIQLLAQYEKDYEEHLHEDNAERFRQLYSKEIELVRSQFPEERAWRFHQANLYHHTAIQKYGAEKAREALEFVDKAISTDDRARHRMLKAKLCHKCGRREEAIAELDYICANFSDSPLYLDARKLKDEIESEPKGGCFVATAAYGSPLATEIICVLAASERKGRKIIWESWRKGFPVVGSGRSNDRGQA